MGVLVRYGTFAPYHPELFAVSFPRPGVGTRRHGRPMVLLSAAQGLLPSRSAPSLESSTRTSPTPAPLTLPALVEKRVPTPSSIPAALQATLPQRRRTRLRNHAATQTEITELGELHVMQTSLDAVRKELTFVKHELSQLEQRLRYEMRLELEGRMQIHNERCLEKVNYLRRGQDQRVAQVRAANRSVHDSSKQQHSRQLKQLEAKLAALTQSNRRSETDQSRAEAALAQTAKIEELTLENEKLHEQLAGARAQQQQIEVQAQAMMQKEVAKLEAKVVSRDKSIEVLRRQLSEARRTDPPESGTEPAVTAPELPAVASSAAGRPSSAARPVVA